MVYYLILLLLAGTAEASYIQPTPVPTATPQPTATPANTPVPTATVVPTATPGAGTAPGGASGNVQYNNGASGFGAESNFSYDFTNNRLLLSGLTTATDDSLHMMDFSGTMPTTPSGAGANGFLFNITSAGSADVGNGAGKVLYGAGYTGANFTHGLASSNAAAGTGANLRLSASGATNIATANSGFYADVLGSTAGINIAAQAVAANSTTQNVGVYGRSLGTAAGSNIGGLFNSCCSTEATDFKNIALYAVIGSTTLTGAINGSFAGYFDGGTLPDSASQVIRAVGTLPTTLTGTTYGNQFTVTGAGTSSQFHGAMNVTLEAGYTGSSGSIAIYGNSNDAGTGTSLALNTAFTAGVPVAVMGTSTSAGTGFRVGGEFEGQNSTGVNVGAYGKSPIAVAGTNIGVLGNAAASTEATDFKNIAGYFTLNSALIAASNISVALLADNGAVASPIFNAYDNGSLVFSITDGGPVTMTSTLTSSRSTDLGWTVQNAANQACNTTCTTGACVVGLDTGAVGNFLACTDAAADTCLCAG